MTVARDPETVDLTDRDQRSLGRLLADLVDDIRSLVRDQIALAKAEMRSSVRAVAAGAGVLAAAAFVALLMLLFLLLAAAHGIAAAGLPLWAGYLIVGGALLLITVILIAVGVSRFKAAKAPAHSREALERNVEALTPTSGS